MTREEREGEPQKGWFLAGKSGEQHVSDRGLVVCLLGRYEKKQKKEEWWLFAGTADF